MNTPEPHDETAIPGWAEFAECVRTLPERILAKLPPERRRDPQMRQEVARLAQEAIASQLLGSFGSDPDHPQFMPAIGQVLNVGQPNADTVYRSAAIAPGSALRLRGRRGSMRIAVVSEVGPRPADAAQAGAHRAVHDINALSVDADGHYDVILSVERPEGHAGDWWPLSPTTNMLLMRLVSCDWANDREPTVALERLDVPARRPRPTAAALEASLRALPGPIGFMGLMFVDHHEQLRRGGYINALKVFDLAQAGGLQGQFYYEGAYDIADDEALIVEASAPARCRYRSLILTNEIYQTTDWYNNHSSLNDTQAPLDDDGILRIVVSAQDPGVPNWLDTAGHPRGVIQGRWTDCDSQPVPSITKVPLVDVRKHLPPETSSITPSQREQLIRDRRAALLQRTIW